MAGKAAAGEPLGRTAEEAAWAETLRGACEPEHHWRYRREFLLRNVGELPAAGSAQLQRLVSLSMVWANHVFLGCRYPPQVMERALEMAEGIQVTNAPVHTTRDELVAKVKKRGISSSNEGVEEPCKRQAVEKRRDSKDAGKDVKTTKAEGVKETESTLPKKQEKGTSKDPETSQSASSTDKEMVVVSDIETEGKPANAESTAEQKPPSSEKEPGKKPCSSPHKESKCENVPSPEKKTVVRVAPLAVESTPQAAAVVAAVPPAAKSTPQAAAAVAAAVPSASKSTSQAAVVAAAVPPAAKSSPQAAAAAAAVPVTAKSTPQAAAAAAAVPPTTKSTPQAAVAAAVPPTTKSTPQTSSALLSSKTQASAPASVSKNGAQVSSSLLLAPKSGPQVGTSLLLASKGPAKVGSPLLASKSSAEVAASLLAARSGAQPGSSLLASKSSAQVAASLLAARSGAQQGPSRAGAQAGASLLASKSGSQAGESPAKALCKPLTSEDAKERQPFFNRLYKAVAWKLVAVGGFSPNVNHAELLNSSIQSVKATLDVAFVPLKELADLPQNKSSLENIVCELRCKSVYLGTGCGKSMENAKAVASREALKLFLKKKVIVKICKRKYKGSEIEDLVLLDEESKPSNLPPALRNPREIL
ncbi:CDKN2A-interacting protein isoform X1 [Oenanthe melanoleuca]|uniref:CDKN2A-interacting protein isoform X1 n=1 Tax=Oenanthe melanoleuca TaxID=2939378 RepID=UPI0024C18BFF|nr:CDKN2A-interacting protein isoform X1 [Oenanthe melanoleuca]